MTIKRFSLLIVSLVVCPSTFATAAQLPNGITAGDVDPVYGNSDYAWAELPSLGYMIFDYDLPERAELSEAERYMIAGGRSQEGDVVDAWWHEVLLCSLAYEAKFGELPSQLGLAEINAVVSDSDVRSRLLVFLKNPITGEPARVDAAKFAPGNMYIRKLTEQERRHIAEDNDHYRNMWYNKIAYSGETQQWERIALLSGSYYYRVYGNDGVILSGLFQSWTETYKLSD